MVDCENRAILFGMSTIRPKSGKLLLKLKKINTYISITIKFKNKLYLPNYEEVHKEQQQQHIRNRKPKTKTLPTYFSKAIQLQYIPVVLCSPEMYFFYQENVIQINADKYSHLQKRR